MGEQRAGSEGGTHAVVLRVLRERLGEPDVEWDFADGRLHVLRFPDRPQKGDFTFLTVGLSEVILQQDSGPIRQELLFACTKKYAELPIADGLALLAGERALAGRPFYDGELLGPAGWLGNRVGLRWFLASQPQWWPGLAEPIPLDPPSGFIWLIPVTPSEAAVAEAQGTGVLEDAFGQRQPDFLDLGRRSVL